MTDNYPTETFKTAAAWRQWLTKHHAASAGIWVRIFKKHTNTETVSYAEALDEALCFGWIDGQKAKYDDESWLQKFTPRRPKSVWSKRNREHVERLVKEHRMTPAGLAEVEAAKKDGRWDSAYDAASTMEVPEDFITELKEDETAYAFFKTLNKANTYSIAWRLQTAKKPETRQRRKTQLLELLKAGKKLH
ncbi:YdeI/OmpD-associated family protein [Kordiimonas marina]|uniref:YdeI/OmpD-associated family protein n=1 Tax=Kordiimonas marina TaxID=2872312 RepID=UPI001FF5ECC0|nr:YdeI/OmpD-associated family protein [Kordiimonas marina]MCJ9430166.1 YdeI/OmpD-associated family protein [Kordiimonas marina]